MDFCCPIRLNSLILAMLEIDLPGPIASEQGIARGSANQKGRPDWPFSSH
jgi:hypothetical protein